MIEESKVQTFFLSILLIEAVLIDFGFVESDRFSRENKMLDCRFFLHFVVYLRLHNNKIMVQSTLEISIAIICSKYGQAPSLLPL